MLGAGFDQLDKLLSALQAPALRVHPAYCSRLRHRLSKCARCSEHCPTKAIEWTDSLKVDPDRCTSCGICANACPNGVFEALKPTDEEILGKVKLLLNERQEIIFECHGPKGTHRGQVKQSSSIRVSCLARLDEAVLVGSVALGAKSVCLINGSCEGCEYESSRHLAEETVNAANGIFELFGLPKRVFLKDKLEVTSVVEEEAVGEKSVEPVGTSRREFFAFLARETQKTGALLVGSIVDSYRDRDADKPKKGGELPVRLPTKRRLLLSAMKGLGSPTERASEAKIPFFCHFEIDENCTGCQMCAFFCPTGALEKVEEEGRAGVSFKISHCTACGLCREICYKEAVRLSHRIDLHKVIDGDIDVINMREGHFVSPWQQQLLGKG
ncbi:MAG: 4Fe-4S binding protein [Anaerolineae bacterium]